MFVGELATMPNHSEGFVCIAKKQNLHTIVEPQNRNSVPTKFVESCRDDGARSTGGSDQGCGR